MAVGRKKAGIRGHMTPGATGRNVWGNGPNCWCCDPASLLDVCSFPRYPVSLSLCLFSFPLCWLDLTLLASSLPQQQSPYFLHTLPVCWRWPVPAAAGDREIAGPQQCHPKCILPLASAAKCLPHEWSNEVYVARQETRSRMGTGFK